MIGWLCWPCWTGKPGAVRAEGKANCVAWDCLGICFDKVCLIDMFSLYYNVKILHWQLP